VYRLSVFQKDNAQSTIAHLRDARPPPNPAILLTFFAQRVLNDLLDSLIADDGTVRASPGVKEVARGLHDQASYTFSTSSP
jgi:hypothetical protein